MINIFSKPAFLNTASNTPFISKEESYKGNGHLQRVSSMIRGDQIAEYLGARLNPAVWVAGEVCIFVKPHVKADEPFFFAENSYVDIIDGWGLIPLLEKHPEVGVIACSKKDYEILKTVLPNKVVLIPQHHCNFERVKKEPQKIKTVGIIGTEDAFEFIPEELEAGLKKREIQLLKYSKFFSREDIVEFYKKIDVQIVWRPYRMRLSNPLKLVNAASFGIPTIAYDEVALEELGDAYMPVKSVDSFFTALDVLDSDMHLYERYRKKLIMLSELYHIDNIARLYKQL